jgi:hypothetical protein
MCDCVLIHGCGCVEWTRSGRGRPVTMESSRRELAAARDGKWLGRASGGWSLWSEGRVDLVAAGHSGEWMARQLPVI